MNRRGFLAMLGAVVAAPFLPLKTLLRRPPKVLAPTLPEGGYYLPPEYADAIIKLAQQEMIMGKPVEITGLSSLTEIDPEAFKRLMRKGRVS